MFRILIFSINLY